MNKNEQLLFDTRVHKKSTCLSYALDRVGLSDSYSYVKEIPSSKFISFDAYSCKIGDIVAWKSSNPKRLFATSIISIDNHPVTIKNIEDCSYHLGVVEVVNEYDFIISDCIRSLNSNSHPEIRLNLYNKCDSEKIDSKFPDYIIKI